MRPPFGSLDKFQPYRRGPEENEAKDLQGEGTNLGLYTTNTFFGVLIFYQEGASGAKAAKDGGATLSVALVFVLDEIIIYMLHICCCSHILHGNSKMESISSSQATIADIRAVFQGLR